MCSYDGGSCGQQRGHDLAQPKLSNPSLDAFFFSLFFYDFRLAFLLAPAKKEEVPPRVAAYIAP